MKFNKFLMMGAATTIAAVGVAGHQAYAVTDSLTVEAVVVETLTLDCAIADLNFGTIDAGAAHTVTMTTAGARSSTVPAQLVPADTGTAGQCDLTGEPTFDVQVTIPASTTITDGTDTITVNNFTLDGGDGANASPENLTLDGSGDGSILVGGDLVVTGTEGAGTYTGTVTITALYN